MKLNNEHLDKQTIKQTGSVYTPLEVVKQMLDMVDEEQWRDPHKVFCDPTCGVGNIIIPMLDRRVELGIEPTVALNTMVGNELVPKTYEVLMDNLHEWAREHNVVSTDWEQNFTNMDFFEWVKLYKSEPVDEFLQ